MGKFAWAVDLAKELLQASGEFSTLVRTLGGTPADPNKPWDTGAPVVTKTRVSAVWVKNSILRRPSLVKDTDSFVILAAKDLESRPDPATDHLLRADGRRFTVLQVDPLDPAGEEVIYEVKVSA